MKCTKIMYEATLNGYIQCADATCNVCDPNVGRRPPGQLLQPSLLRSALTPLALHIPESSYITKWALSISLCMNLMV